MLGEQIISRTSRHGRFQNRRCSGKNNDEIRYRKVPAFSGQPARHLQLFDHLWKQVLFSHGNYCSGQVSSNGGREPYGGRPRRIRSAHKLLTMSLRSRHVAATTSLRRRCDVASPSVRATATCSKYSMRITYTHSMRMRQCNNHTPRAKNGGTQASCQVSAHLSVCVGQ